MTEPSRSVLAASARLQTAKFAGLPDRYLDAAERPVRAADASVEVADIRQGPAPRWHYDLAVVLTDANLWAFRPRALLGDRKPLVLPLDHLRHIGVTRDGCFRVEYEGPHGAPGQWKILVNGGLDEADVWMRRVAALLGGDSDGDRPESSDGELLAGMPAVIEELRSFATPGHRGRPFGQGHGLESAVASVTPHVGGYEPLVAAGYAAMVGILGATNETEADVPVSMRRAMGVGSPEPSAQQANELGEAAIGLLGQFGGPGSLWELWSRNEEVAMEMLCWHLVAHLRLAEEGVIAPPGQVGESERG